MDKYPSVKFKRTFKQRFFDWFFNIDYSFVISLLGFSIVNAILIRHVNLPFWETLLESFFLGVGLVGILK